MKRREAKGLSGRGVGHPRSYFYLFIFGGFPPFFVYTKGSIGSSGNSPRKGLPRTFAIHDLSFSTAMR